MKYLLILLLASAVCADILIGDKPCLWKRPITRYTCKDDGRFDTLYFDKNDNLIGRSPWVKPKKYAYSDLHPRCTWRTDTTDWERYWDSCERGK